MPESDLATKKKEAETLKSVEISKLSLQWLQVLAEGWASPLSGERFNRVPSVDNVLKEMYVVFA